MENEPDQKPNSVNVSNPSESQLPPQGNPTATSVSPSEVETPKRFGKKTILLVVLAVLVVGSGAALAYSHFHKSAKKTPVASTNSATKSSTNTATQPAVTYSSVLVFQPSSSTSSSTTAVLGLDGTKLASFSAKASDATYDGSGFSQANLELVGGSALITTDKSWSSFALVTADGKSTPIASSLNTLLAANAHPNSATSLSNGITIGKNTLLALENSSSDSKLVKINLSDGTTTNLFSLVSTKTNAGAGYTPVQLVTTSRDGTKAYLLTDSVTINSTAAPNNSLVTVDLTTGKFTIKSVPSLDVSSAAVSKDGNWVAYIDIGANNGYANATTHLVNVQTGKDTPVATEGLEVSDGAQALRFSNDGAYLSVVGSYAADTHKNGMEMQIISTATNAVVQKVDREGTQYESDGIVGFDWASDHSFIYATNSSTTGNFNPDQEAVHSIDASTGKTFDFPASGQLLAVLNYQN
jgi:hypothetical protein